MNTYSWKRYVRYVFERLLSENTQQFAVGRWKLLASAPREPGDAGLLRQVVHRVDLLGVE